MSGVIHLDCDGVLLNWRDAFVEWLREHDMLGEENPTNYDLSHMMRIPGTEDKPPAEFCKMLSHLFNESHHLESIPPIEGAVKQVRRLYEAGYDLRVVSSYTTDYKAMKKREDNLTRAFGNVFSRITSLPLMQCKRDYLDKQNVKDDIFIEDSFTNLQRAYYIGYSPYNLYLYVQKWNENSVPSAMKYGMFITTNWKNITESILGE